MAIRQSGYWREVLALCCAHTPVAHLDSLRSLGVEAVAVGRDRVDLRAALEYLYAQHGVRTVRVESGGTLNGALLRAGLVSEVSLLIHPQLIGGASSQSFFRATDLASAIGVLNVRLTGLERLENGLVWLRYEVIP